MMEDINENHKTEIDVGASTEFCLPSLMMFTQCVCHKLIYCMLTQFSCLSVAHSEPEQIPVTPSTFLYHHVYNLSLRNTSLI